MALKQTSVVTALLALFFVLPAAQGARKTKLYAVRSRDCALHSKTDQKVKSESWSAIPEGKSFPGRTVEGKKPSESLVYFVSQKKIYFADAVCFIERDRGPTSESLLQGPKDTPELSPAPTSAPSSASLATVQPVKPLDTHWAKAFELSVVGWHEAITLTDSRGEAHDLRGNYLGICPGIHLRKTLTSRWSLATGVCGLVLRNDVSDSATASTFSGYNGSSKSAFGVFTSIGIYFTPTASEDVRAGFSIPLVFRTNTQVDPSADASFVPGNSALLPGMLLDMRFIAGNFQFAPRVGFLRSLSNFTWLLSFSYSL